MTESVPRISVQSLQARLDKVKQKKWKEEIEKIREGVKEMNLTEKEKLIFREFEAKNNLLDYDFLYKRPHRQFIRDKPRFKKALEIGNSGRIMDVLGDGNCGYHALVLGTVMQALKTNTNYMEHNNPSLELRKQMLEHARKPGVVRRIIENEHLFFNAGLSSIPENFDERLMEAIERQGKAPTNPLPDDRNNAGFDNLAYTISGICPKEDLAGVVPPEYMMDPYLDLALFADMTKSRVVMHHLHNDPADCHFKNLPERYPKFVYDARDDNIQIQKIDNATGFIDEDDSKTVNIVFDENHYMLLKRNYEETSGKRPKSGQPNQGPEKKIPARKTMARDCFKKNEV